MKKAVKLCRLYRNLSKLLPMLLRISFITIIGLFVVGVVTRNFVLKVAVTVGLLLVGIFIGGSIVRLNARRAVCREIKNVMEYYFIINGQATRVKTIHVSENNYEVSYNVCLTNNSNIYEYDMLIMDLNYLRDNIASALKKRVQVYCNGNWVN